MDRGKRSGFSFSFMFLDELISFLVLQVSLSRPKSTFGLTLQNIPHITYNCRPTRRENLSSLFAMVRILSLSPPFLWSHPTSSHLG
jgi:hypothetical protein